MSQKFQVKFFDTPEGTSNFKSKFSVPGRGLKDCIEQYFRLSELVYIFPAGEFYILRARTRLCPVPQLIECFAVRMMDDVAQPLSAGLLHRGVAMVYRLPAPCSRSTGIYCREYFIIPSWSYTWVDAIRKNEPGRISHPYRLLFCLVLRCPLSVGRSGSQSLSCVQ